MGPDISVQHVADDAVQSPKYGKRNLQRRINAMGTRVGNLEADIEFNVRSTLAQLRDGVCSVQAVASAAIASAGQDTAAVGRAYLLVLLVPVVVAG